MTETEEGVDEANESAVPTWTPHMIVVNVCLLLLEYFVPRHSWHFRLGAPVRTKVGEFSWSKPPRIAFLTAALPTS